MSDLKSGPANAEGAKDDAGDAARVNIDYIKGNLFRTISASGLMASLSPHGEIQIAFFSERQAIPQRVVYKLNPDGTLGDEIETIERNAIVREIDIVVSLDLETAEGLAGRLREMVEDVKRIGGNS
jgi:hypothetical protein